MCFNWLNIGDVKIHQYELVTSFNVKDVTTLICGPLY